MVNYSAKTAKPNNTTAPTKASDNKTYLKSIDGNLALQLFANMTPSQLAKVDKVDQLNALGLQVISAMPHQKRPIFKWRGLKYTRIEWTHPDFRHYAPVVFQPHYNLLFIAGYASDGAFAIDCDNELIYQSFKQAFIRMFGKTRFTKTSKGGHILVRCTNALIKTAKIFVNGRDEGDIKGNNSLVVLPSSTKKLADGSIFTYYEDVGSTHDIIELTIEQLQAFFKTVAPETQIERWIEPKRRKKHSQLKQKTIDVLNGNIHKGSRNIELNNAVLDYRRYHDRATTEHVMVEAGLRLSPEPEEQNTVKPTVLSALNAYDRTRSTSHYKLAKTALAHIPFTGKSAKSQKAVYKALLERSRLEAGKPSFIATYRQLMILSGIRSKTTISKALKNLQTAKLITNVTPPTPKEQRDKNASEWQWNIDTLKSISLDDTKTLHKCTTRAKLDYGYSYSGTGMQEYDVKNGEYFERCLRQPDVFGNTAIDIYMCILNNSDGYNMTTISQILGIAVSTVSRNLKQLCEWHLVDKSGRIHTAQYNATHIYEVLVKKDGFNKYQQHIDNIQYERMRSAIEFICMSIIRSDRQHPYHIAKASKSATEPPKQPQNEPKTKPTVQPIAIVNNTPNDANMQYIDALIGGLYQDFGNNVEVENAQLE